jgi:hypothetical protein
MTLTEGCTILHLASLRLDAPGIRASLRLDAPGIRASLDTGCDPNRRDALGRTPLCCALGHVDAGHSPFRDAWTAAVVALVAGGADLDATRYVGGKPLRGQMPAWLRERVEAHEFERTLQAAIQAGGDGATRPRL